MDAVASHMPVGQSLWDFSCDLEVNLESEENALIVYWKLAVDKKLQPDKVKRHMSISDGKLLVILVANRIIQLKSLGKE